MVPIPRVLLNYAREGVTAAESSAGELAEVFAQVARSLLAEPSLEGVLGRICSVAVEVVPGCEHAATSIVRGRKIETLASTGHVPEQVDAIQYQTDEGPCLDAIREHEVFETGDLLLEDRWPRFAERAAAETGIHSMLSLRLYAEQDTYGALNLYSGELDAFTDDSHAIASVLAAHGAVAFAGAKEHEKTEHLERAVESRDVIGQAKGILMHKRGITADQAFDMLRTASQHLNRRLHDVAAEVAETGSDPEHIG
jgi:transcriptional regulator with GAF, ATPase, and Fis domain